MQCSIDLGCLGEVNVEVEYHYSPGVPARGFDPPEPFEFEVTSATVDGREILWLVKEFLENDDDTIAAAQRGYQNESRVAKEAQRADQEAMNRAGFSLAA